MHVVFSFYPNASGTNRFRSQSRAAAVAFIDNITVIGYTQNVANALLMRKSMKKKLIIPVILALVLTACGTGNTEGKTDNDVLEKAVIASVEAKTETSATVDVGDSQADIDSVDTEAEDITTTSQDMEGTDMKEAATLYYQGHASVRIATPEGKTIYVDPYMGDGYDVPADLILITHGHHDHTQTDLITTKNDGCETITWKEAIKDGAHQTFEYDFVTVEAVEAGYNKNHNAKECVGYILTFTNGATLYLSGDTSTTPQMSELAGRNLDYAFFCCDGVYNMDMSEAIECANLVGAKHSIPYHMAPGKDFDKAIAETFDVANRIIIAPGEELTLE